MCLAISSAFEKYIVYPGIIEPVGKNFYETQWFEEYLRSKPKESASHRRSGVDMVLLTMRSMHQRFYPSGYFYPTFFLFFIGPIGRSMVLRRLRDRFNEWYNPCCLAIMTWMSLTLYFL